MLPLGMVLGLVGYGVSTWGYVLVKGYNITLGQWFSPLHPHTGALGSNGFVPKGNIFPTSGKGSSSSASSGGTNPIQKQQKQNLQHANPHGFVQ